MMSQIRKVVKPDLDAVKEVIDTNGLFPSNLLEKMMIDFFINPSTEDIWLTKEINTVPIAISYCAPERMTNGTYNLYLIAVHKDYQGKGVGGEMMNYVEKLLVANGKRLLLVETSGLPEFELTRKFYDKCNYKREALIRDFYSEGEDKVIFWKKLTEK
jgi:ribosomal protein S18 acetylase RimI-like enzyme